MPLLHDGWGGATGKPLRVQRRSSPLPLDVLEALAKRRTHPTGTTTHDVF